MGEYYNQFLRDSVDTLEPLTPSNAPNWEALIALGEVRFVDPNSIPRFESGKELAEYMTSCKYTVTSCREKQLDLSIRFLDSKSVQAIMSPTSFIFKSGKQLGCNYLEDKLEFSFYPTKGGIKYIRLKKGRNSYFILDFVDFQLDWYDLETNLLNLDLPIGPYPSVGKIARNLILKHGMRGLVVGEEIPEEVELLATQVFGIGRFEAFWRGKAPPKVVYEDRKSAYPHEVGILQSALPPYTKWVNINQIQDLNKEIRNENVCYAFIHLSENASPDFISTTKVRCRAIGGVKQIFPGNGHYGNLTYGLHMLRLKLDEGHSFGTTLFPIAGYLGYRQKTYNPFWSLAESLYKGKKSDDPYTSWLYKQIGAQIVGNFASNNQTYEFIRPPTLFEIDNDRYHKKLELSYKGRNTYFTVYAAHVVDAQIANTTRRAKEIIHPEGKVLGISIDGIKIAGVGNRKYKINPEPVDWWVKRQNRDPWYIWGDALSSDSEDTKWLKRYNRKKGLLILSRLQYPILSDVYRKTKDEQEAKKLRDAGPISTEYGRLPGSGKRVWNKGALDFLTEGGPEDLASPMDIPRLLMGPSRLGGSELLDLEEI